MSEASQRQGRRRRHPEGQGCIKPRGQEGEEYDDDELGNMELHSDNEQRLDTEGCKDDDGGMGEVNNDIG